MHASPKRLRSYASVADSTKLPNIDLGHNQTRINEVVKEHLEVRGGKRGRVEDRYVTVQDLINAGLIASAADLEA